jgi:hypothetical protein
MESIKRVEAKLTFFSPYTYLTFTLEAMQLLLPLGEKPLTCVHWITSSSSTDLSTPATGATPASAFHLQQESSN